jgi:TRIAD3 protein (E3 ubiquitin-protein ligase RNF216)
LSPKLFSKVAQKKALEEIKSAGIEELEMCPFCDFATIPAEGYNIFTCLNPECMKESCRMCKEPSHVPLRCDEIEKDEDVRARTFVENKMTEALLRYVTFVGTTLVPVSANLKYERNVKSILHVFVYVLGNVGSAA